MGKLKENKNRMAPFSAEDLSDEEFEQLVREEFLKEAAEIEKDLADIPDSEEWKPTEEKFQQLMSRIKEIEKNEESDNTSEKTDDKYKQSTNEKTEQQNKRNRKFSREHIRGGVVKWTAFAAVTAFGIFGVSLSSQANRAYIVGNVNRIFGDKLKTKINNDEVLEADNAEETARKKIESTFAIKLPKLFYMPDGMKYQKYYIDTEAETGTLEYSCGEEIVYLMIFSNKKGAAGIAQSDSGNKMAELHSDLTLDISVALVEILEPGDEKPAYILQWNHKNTYCEIFGKISKEEMEKIAKKIMY